MPASWWSYRHKLDEDVLKDKDVKIPFVGPDNRKAARQAGLYLAKRLQPGDKVAILEGAPNAYNGIQRRQGFEDAMNAAGMNIVSSLTGYWETDKAQPVASANDQRAPGPQGDPLRQ